MLTTILFLALVASIVAGVVAHRRTHAKLVATRAAAKEQLAAMRTRMDAMRAQITTATNALHLAQDELQRHRAKRELVAMLNKGDKVRTLTDQVLTSSGFADTLPADGFQPTLPDAGFHQTRQEPIEGFVGMQQRTRR